MSRIFVTSLQSSTVRDKYKIDHISPLIKKTRLNIEVTQDYRSVSNVASLSKVIERIVIRQLNVHTQENNLGDLVQSAYRRHHSAEIALLKADGDVLQVIDGGYIVVLPLLELSAAFVTIDHGNVLSRFTHRFGVTGAALELFWST